MSLKIYNLSNTDSNVAQASTGQSKPYRSGLKKKNHSAKSFYTARFQILWITVKKNVESIQFHSINGICVTWK